MISRRLQLNDMDAAAAVQRTALLHALPIFQGLHTPEEVSNKGGRCGHRPLNKGPDESPV
jgi:hypothetical protein